MRPFLILSCALLLSWGCGGGGASYKMASPAYAPQQAAPQAQTSRSAVDRGGYELGDSFTSLSKSGSKRVSDGQAAPSDDRASKPKKPEPSDPMVVYTGWMGLRVRKPIQVMDAITLWVESKKGYIQSLTDRVIVVRVPSKDFEAALAHFATLGEVLDRQIQALDVSTQFTDLSARLAVSREARARLLVLLEQVKNVQERLRVLQEIKRLSEQIETMESTLNTLKKLANFSTITVSLTPMVVNTQAKQHRSPFPWVRDLKAHRVSIREDKDKVHIDLPKGFVLFDKEDYYRAQAADTTLIRAGSVPNEPLGGAQFWAKAVHFEMDGRDEEHVEEGTAGNLRWHLYRSKTLRPRDYLVGVQAVGDRLFVVEVFFPNAKSAEQHGAAIKAALQTFRVK